MSELPAYGIPLAKRDLILLGEVIVIFGQIDNEMARSLMLPLGIDRDAANRLMMTQERIDLWAGILKGRCAHEDFDAALCLAVSELKSVNHDRNDFVHADYRPAFSFQGVWVTVRGFASSAEDEPWSGKVIVSRNRDQKRREHEDIQSLRNRAARASRLVAHIACAVDPNRGWGSSSWLFGIEKFLARSAGRPPKSVPPSTSIVTFD